MPELNDQVHEDLIDISTAIDELRDEVTSWRVEQQNEPEEDPGLITEPIIEALQSVVSTLQEEVQRLDKDVVLKSDFFSGINLLMDDKEEVAVLEVLKAIERKIPTIEKEETVDYTDLLNKIANKLQPVDLSAIEAHLANVKLELPLDKGRVKVVLPDDQVNRFVSMGGTDNVKLGEINDKLTNKISTLNSTNQQLGVNETWTGTWEDVTAYAEAIVTIYTTHTSVENGLKVQWSMNGVDVQGDDLFTIGANSGKTFSFPCQTKYFRVTYINDGVATTTFQLQTSLKVRASKGSSHRLADALVGQDDAIVTKTLVAGFTTAGGGGIVDVKVNPSGALAVSVGDSALPAGAATESTLQSILGAIGGGSFATRIQKSGTDTFVGQAAVGSADASAVWQAQKIDANGNITWADGDDLYDNVATNLTTLSYS